jgi:hypothetical protein
MIPRLYASGIGQHDDAHDAVPADVLSLLEQRFGLNQPPVMLQRSVSAILQRILSDFSPANAALLRPEVRFAFSEAQLIRAKQHLLEKLSPYHRDWELELHEMGAKWDVIERLRAIIPASGVTAKSLRAERATLREDREVRDIVESIVGLMSEFELAELVEWFDAVIGIYAAREEKVRKQ